MCIIREHPRYTHFVMNISLSDPLPTVIGSNKRRNNQTRKIQSVATDMSWILEKIDRVPRVDTKQGMNLTIYLVCQHGHRFTLKNRSIFSKTLSCPYCSGRKVHGPSFMEDVLDILPPLKSGDSPPGSDLREIVTSNEICRSKRPV